MLEKLYFLHESDIRQVLRVCDISFFEQGITTIDKAMEKIKQRNMFKKIKDINEPLYTKLNELMIDALIELWALNEVGSELRVHKTTNSYEEWLKLAKYRYKDSDLTDDRSKQLIVSWLVGQPDLRYHLILASRYLGIALITRVT